jgi:hypothetical protein
VVDVAGLVDADAKRADDLPALAALDRGLGVVVGRDQLGAADPVPLDLAVLALGERLG